MLTITNGMVIVICDAKCRGAVTHNAIKGQSLLQSGCAGFAGQHGISSMAPATIDPTAIELFVDASTPTAAVKATAGRTIGASTRPATAKTVNKRTMASRICTPTQYHAQSAIESH
jgi:hypothetical protein